MLHERWPYWILPSYIDIKWFFFMTLNLTKNILLWLLFLLNYFVKRWVNRTHIWLLNSFSHSDSRKLYICTKRWYKISEKTQNILFYVSFNKTLKQTLTKFYGFQPVFIKTHPLSLNILMQVYVFFKTFLRKKVGKMKNFRKCKFSLNFYNWFFVPVMPG